MFGPRGVLRCKATDTDDLPKSRWGDHRGAHRQQWIEPSEEACAEGITSEFDRVFLVDESTHKVYEIPTKSVAVP